MQTLQVVLSKKSAHPAHGIERAIVKENLISICKKDKWVDAILMEYAIGIVRSLSFAFHWAAAAPLCLYNSQGFVSVVHQSVISKLIAFACYLSAQDVFVHKSH